MARRVIILVAVALVAWPAFGASAGGRAHVWLQDGTTTTVVRGAGFHARQLVVVTVSAGADHLRGHATTTAAGSFGVRFGQSLDAGCKSTFVEAVDASGRRAVLKIVPSCGARQGP